MTFLEKLKNKQIIFYYISHHDLAWFQRIFSSYDVIDIQLFEKIDELTAAVLNNWEQDVIFVLWMELTSSELIWMTRKFRRANVKNYCYVTRNEYMEVMDAYLINYLNKRNIDIHGDVIQIGDFKMINFFKYEKYGIEMGDFILPCLFNDNSMLEDGPHETDQVHLSKGDIVFDCGAHNGSFSMYSLIKGCEVHAFEPVPETFERLRQNLALYHSEKIHLLNKGVWDRTERQPFYLSDDSATDSAILRKDGQVKTLEVVSIDEYVEENNIKRVDFVKADIEGAERQMLEGMRETILKFHPKLSICTYHNHDDPEVLEALICSIDDNYTIHHKWHKIYAYA